jgi:hypothetical protein
MIPPLSKPGRLHSTEEVPYRRAISNTFPRAEPVGSRGHVNNKPVSEDRTAGVLSFDGAMPAPARLLTRRQLLGSSPRSAASSLLASARDASKVKSWIAKSHFKTFNRSGSLEPGNVKERCRFLSHRQSQAL